MDKPNTSSKLYSGISRAPYPYSRGPLVSQTSTTRHRHQFSSSVVGTAAPKDPVGPRHWTSAALGLRRDDGKHSPEYWTRKARECTRNSAGVKHEPTYGISLKELVSMVSVQKSESSVDSSTKAQPDMFVLLNLIFTLLFRTGKPRKVKAIFCSVTYCSVSCEMCR